jgi:RNA polymerase sigma-70 factor (ECF subfamily)
MLSDAQFTELLQRVRAGDQEAAREFVLEYEPEIRRAARLRLTDPKLRRIVDSIDICQSVFGRFFRNLTEGAFELERPEQLLVLLTTMTKNRVIDEHRRQTAAKRASVDAMDVQSPEQLVDESPGPRTAAAARELLDKVRARMTADELNISDRRSAGQSWEEISAELNESAESIRKRLERAIKRVRQEMEDNEES